jgi:hypothetical protein
MKPPKKKNREKKICYHSETDIRCEQKKNRKKENKHRGN